MWQHGEHTTVRLSSLWLLRLLRREACTWFALRAGGRQYLTYPFAAVMCMAVECVVLDALQCVSGKRRRVLPGNQPREVQKVCNCGSWHGFKAAVNVVYQRSYCFVTSSVNSLGCKQRCHHAEIESWRHQCSQTRSLQATSPLGPLLLRMGSDRLGCAMGSDSLGCWVCVAPAELHWALYVIGSAWI